MPEFIIAGFEPLKRLLTSNGLLSAIKNYARAFIMSGMKQSAILLMLLTTVPVFAQTDTPTPDIYIYATVTSGQMTRFDYVVTGGSVQIGSLLTLLLFSMWGMFFLGIFVFLKGKKP